MTFEPIGAWLSRDPLGEREGPNIYAYVLNSPMNLTDPLGLAGGGGLAQDGFGAPKNGSPGSGGCDNTPYGKVLLGFEAVPLALLIGEAYAPPAVLYHFTSAAAAASIAADGTITAGSGLFGTGVYASSVLSPTAATLMGAGATDAAIAIPTAGLTVTPTLIPGSFVISVNVTLSYGVTILF